MVDFYQAVTGHQKPFWLSYECPRCKKELHSRRLCDHGDVYNCPSCGFEQFAGYQGEENECPSCAAWWNDER